MEIKKYIPNTFVYRIKTGETKESIAKRFNTNLNDIACLTSDEMCEGAFVEIKNMFENFYIVKPVDDLKTVASKFNVSIEKIKEINNLKDNRLFVGQRLKF